MRLKINISLGFICFALPSVLLGQFVEAIYLETRNFSIGVNTMEKVLLMDNGKSVYFLEKAENRMKTQDKVVETKAPSQYIRKDFRGKKMLYNQYGFSRTKIISEPIPLQKWTLTPETKKIGAYLCKKAVTQFRGREYIAWYTESIPAFGGPWKFDGLNGLLVEIASTDGVFSIELMSVAFKKGEFIAPQPEIQLNENDALTWEAFCLDFKTQVEKYKKYAKAKSEPGDELRIRFHDVEDLGIWEVKIR